jgi:hypothetical protein
MDQWQVLREMATVHGIIAFPSITGRDSEI